MRSVIAAEAPDVRDTCRQAVLGCGLDCAAADCVPFGKLPRRLAHDSTDLVLVVLDPQGEGLALVPQAAEMTTAPVLAVGPDDSVCISQALRAGARAYLDQRDFRAQLLEVLESFQQAGTLNPSWGRTLVVIGATPGSGVTTVAANLAFALADKHPGQTVLAELDDGVPGLALNLDLKPRYSVADLGALWEIMDAIVLRQVLVETSGLSILAYRPDTLQGEALSPPAVRQTMALLRSLFSYVVVDLGHVLEPAQLAALALADKVVVVLRLDVPSIRLTRQFLRRLEGEGISTERVRLLANRHGQSGQISRRQAEQALGSHIPEWVPEDPATVNGAMNKGLPLLRTSRRAAITRSFDALASRLNGHRHS
jgi:pilus assembly protein CpaE